MEFRAGQCSSEFENNLGFINEVRADGIEAQKLMAMLEIARSLDLIAQRLDRAE